MSDFAKAANTVARLLKRDAARKRAILARTPRLAYAFDAQELDEMSSRELAARELKELGIDAGDNDPLAILDAHHAGRAFERNRVSGRGAAQDSSSESSFVGRYLNSDK
jgi:ABC-type hemin transport system ATPase subunit